MKTEYFILCASITVLISSILLGYIGDEIIKNNQTVTDQLLKEEATVKQDFATKKANRTTNLNLFTDYLKKDCAKKDFDLCHVDFKSVADLDQKNFISLDEATHGQFFGNLNQIIAYYTVVQQLNNRCSKNPTLFICNGAVKSLFVVDLAPTFIYSTVYATKTDKIFGYTTEYSKNKQVYFFDKDINNFNQDLKQKIAQTIQEDCKSASNANQFICQNNADTFFDLTYLSGAKLKFQKDLIKNNVAKLIAYCDKKDNTLKNFCDEGLQTVLDHYVTSSTTGNKVEFVKGFW